jgi:Ca2+-binding RTX toxin-like protein
VRRRAALIAVLAALAGADAASAGQLSAFGADGVLYAHLDGLEHGVAHELVVEPAPGGLYRVTDATADIHLCVAPCDPPPCVQLADPREAFCALGASGFQAILGPSNDHLENTTALALFACGGDGSDVIISGAGRDVIGGGPGRDEVFGGAGDDSLIADATKAGGPAGACAPGAPVPFELIDGGPGRDQIEGGAGDDVLAGGDDDDIILGFGGDDDVDGGAGRDDLAGLDGDDELDGGADGDFLFGGAGDDDLEGGAGDDDLGRTLVYDVDGLGSGSERAASVEDGDDRLDGGDGRDFLIAGPGDSRYDTAESLAMLLQGIVDRRLQSPALNGSDRYVGGPGEDLVTYVNRDLPVSVTLDGLADDGSAGEGDFVDPDVDRVWGGARVDELVAAPAGSLLFGDLGADRITGGPGPDRLSGGTDDSADAIAGHGGDDQIAGNAGDDALDGGAGADLVFGGSGDDAVAGGPGDDRVEGAAGADRLDGGGGTDCLAGFLLPESDPACAAGELAGTTGAGADGADTLTGGAGVDRLYGGDGEDIADYAAAARPVVVVLPGARGPDTTPADVLAADVEGARGGRGPDMLIGNGADNVLDGGPGEDHVDGGDGVDRLRGGSGQDLLVARDGHPDAVRCGTKRDIALVDGADELVAALSDVCERVDGAGRSLGPRVRPTGACSLRIRPPGAARWFPLRLGSSLPAGTVVDAAACAARIGRARVRGGAFALRTEGRRLVLRLTGGRSCRGSGRRARRLDVRRAPVWLAVRGRDLTAFGAGASWTTIDGCSRTRVRVRSGRVRTQR